MGPAEHGSAEHGPARAMFPRSTDTKRGGSRNEVKEHNPGSVLVYICDQKQAMGSLGKHIILRPSGWLRELCIWLRPCA